MEMDQAIPDDHGDRQREEQEEDAQSAYLADEEECLCSPTTARIERTSSSSKKTKERKPRRSTLRASRRWSSQQRLQQQKVEEDQERRKHECRLLLASTAGFLALVGALLMHNSSAPSEAEALAPAQPPLFAWNETTGLPNDPMFMVEPDPNSNEEPELLTSGVLDANHEEAPYMIVRMEDEDEEEP